MELTIKDLNERVLPSLLTNDAALAKEAVEQFFTEVPDEQSEATKIKCRSDFESCIIMDAVFVHPLFEIKGRNEIMRLYRMWAWSNISVTMAPGAVQMWVDMTESAPGAKGPAVCIDVRYLPRPFFTPFKVAPVRILVVLHLVRREPTLDAGLPLYQIRKQEDLIPTASLVSALVPGPFDPPATAVTQWLLRLSGLYAVYLVSPIVFLIRMAVVEPFLFFFTLFGGPYLLSRAVSLLRMLTIGAGKKLTTKTV